jgi:hypothetical protein
MNLALAGSLLLTPWVVHALANSGLSGFSKTLGGIAVGASFITPDKVFKASKSLTTKGFQSGKKSYTRAREFYDDNRHRMAFVRAPLSKVLLTNEAGGQSSPAKTVAGPKDEAIRTNLRSEYQRVETKLSESQPSLKNYQKPGDKEDSK